MTDVEVRWRAGGDPLVGAGDPAPGQPYPAVVAPGPVDDGRARLEKAAARAAEFGIRRIQLLAWRDFEDPEAGGSEVYADKVAALMAEAGFDVLMRTSAAPGLPSEGERSGYRFVRRAGRYTVFPRSALAIATSRRWRPDGLMEFWNGMPFFSPLWSRCPRVVVLHHVHAEMWRMVLPPRLARLGEAIEMKLAPPLYRKSRVLTLSESSRQELVSMLGMRPEQIQVAPCGLDPRFSPGGSRSATPLVVSVGRLVPVKRFPMLIDALVQARRSVPNLRAAIIGEGYERTAVEAKIAIEGAGDWIELRGRVSDDELLDAYRSAWVVANSSAREGWNMTLTEAGACGTPSVVTDVVGHQDSVRHGVTGLLAAPEAMAGALVRLLHDDALRLSLGQGALEHARSLTWEATAAAGLEALGDEALARSR